MHRGGWLTVPADRTRRVKNFKNGFITAPKTLGPESTLKDVLDIKERYGFTGIPITEDGKIGGKLVGLVTNREKRPTDSPHMRGAVRHSAEGCVKTVGGAMAMLHGFHTGASSQVTSTSART